MSTQAAEGTAVRHELVDGTMGRAAAAARVLAGLGQEATDRIAEAVYRAGYASRVRLARMACEETRLGVLRDKVWKNVLATRHVWQDIQHLATVGVVREDPELGLAEIAHPVGPIFAVTPVTNPTSTVLFKVLTALKARNPIVIRPHGAARRCSVEAARVCYQAALEAGAPEWCVQWVPQTSQAETLALMAHRLTALVLATGSVSLVRAAYSSGNPAIGVGPGNVPCFVDESADPAFAAAEIVLSKTFDNGTVCASEQAVVALRPRADELLSRFVERGACVLSPEQCRRLEPVVINREQRAMRPEVIGQPASHIAALAGVEVPPATTVLIAPQTEVGWEAPLSLEVLAPLLAFYQAETFDAAVELCCRINAHGGLGHTATIFAEDEARIGVFAQRLNAGRVLVNTPASQGALGGAYNALAPSLTLGVGTQGKTATTDNISARHLLNIERVARRRLSFCATCHDRVCMDESVGADDLDARCTRHQRSSCEAT